MPRFQIILPDLYYDRLLAWAHLKGTNRATLVANVVQARIEANWEAVDRDLYALARLQGISRADLDQLIRGQLPE